MVVDSDATENGVDSDDDTGWNSLSRMLSELFEQYAVIGVVGGAQFFFNGKYSAVDRKDHMAAGLKV